MKRFLSFIAMALFTQSMCGQAFNNPYPSYDYEHYLNADLLKFDKDLVVKHHVKSMVEVKKGHGSSVNKAFQFDASGQLVKLSVNNNTWLNKSTIEYVLPPGHIAPDYVVYNRFGKEKRSIKYAYNADSMLTQKKVLKRGKLSHYATYNYVDKKMLDCQFYVDDNPEPVKNWVYTYHPDKSLKTSTLYKKGKLEYVWNYECKSEGELIKAHHDTTMVCKNEEIDSDGNKKITVRNYSSNGQPMKQVYVYNQSDQLIDMKLFSRNEKLFYAFHNDVNTLTRGYKYYRKNGKVRSARITKLNSNGDEIETSSLNGRGQVVNRTEHVYNETGKIAQIQTFDKGGKLTGKTVYNYDTNLLLTAIVSQTKDGLVKSEKLVRYDFY